MKLPRQITLYSLLITLLFLSHALFYFTVLGTDAVDDAYISFRYAQNAILGNGLMFNPGERVEGFTNFLWTVAMIPLEGAGVDVGRASMILGWLIGLGLMYLVIRFAKHVGAPDSVGWLAALLLAVDGSFVLWSVSGLETVLFAFLVFAGAFLYVREQDDRQQTTDNRIRASVFGLPSDFPFSGIFFALAGMTRPEGLMIFAITVAHQSAWRILAERRLFTIRDILRGVAFTAIFVPYWLGRWYYFKSFLPNSFHAKVSASGPAAQIARGWNHLNQFVNVHLGWLITVPPVIALSNYVLRFTRSRTRHHASRLFWTTYFFAIIIPYAAYIVYVGGDWSVGRFFVPFLSMFYLLFSTGIVDMWTTVVDKWLKLGITIRRYSGLAVSILLALWIFSSSSWTGEYGIFIGGFDAGNATLARETMGKWLKANVPHGTWIAVDAAGQVPYFSELPSIDMFGINDLHIGRMPVTTLGEGTPGHEKMDVVYVITRQPKYVVIYGTLFDTVKEYERSPLEWTNNPTLKKFLTLYQIKESK
jgi:hypothetical protein